MALKKHGNLHNQFRIFSLEKGFYLVFEKAKKVTPKNSIRHGTKVAKH